MRMLAQLILCFAPAMIASVSLAGNVTIPHTFTSGTPAVADEVNNNFSAIETEVDDNAADIAVNAENILSNSTAINAKQNRVSGTCPSGQSIREINTDGSVSCVEDTDTTYLPGSGISISGTTISTAPQTDYYYLPGAEFQPVYISDETMWHGYDYGLYGYPRSDAVVYLAQSAKLPNGAVMTDFRCYYYDGTPQSDISALIAHLRRGSITSTGSLVLATIDANPTELLGLNSTTIHQVFAETISNAPVDNAYFYYYATISFQASAGYANNGSASDIRFNGCRIEYTH